jgi:hypothetical protein
MKFCMQAIFFTLSIVSTFIYLASIYLSFLLTTFNFFQDGAPSVLAP